MAKVIRGSCTGFGPTFRQRLLGLAVLASLSFATQAANVAVYDQVPAPANQTGALMTSAWYASGGFGSAADFYVYDSFILSADTAITEIEWRGGGGVMSNFTVTFFDSTAGGWQPAAGHPEFPEPYLAKFDTLGTAGETAAGTFGGTALFDYRFVLPTPFQAIAGHKYWVRVEAFQYTYPPLWGMAVGTGGDGQHFTFSTGMARFYFSSGDAAFRLLTLAGPVYRIAASASPPAAGSISGAGVYPVGLSASLIATASPGYVFVNWTENGTPVSTAATYTFTSAADRTLVAHFATAFTITTSAAPASGGGTLGDGSYTYGSAVTVSAAANANYAFVNWTERGVPVSVASQYAFIASADRALTANFVAANANLTSVFSQPHNPASGTVLKSSWFAPNGLDGDQYEWDNFSVSSNVTITEVHWRGGYGYGANHAPVSDFQVAIWPSIGGGSQPDIIGGPIVSYGVGGNAGETVAGTFGGTQMYDYKFVLPSSFHPVPGSNYWVQIEAAQGLNSYSWPPDWGLAVGTGGNNSHFYEIIGGTAGGGNLYATGTGDTAFSLWASASGFSIATIASPTDGGAVAGAGTYPGGASVTVTATPASGFVFVNWNENGLPVSTSSNYQFTASANRTLVGNFGKTWTITAAASPANGGTTTGSGIYLGGADVAAVATPNPGFAFVDWTEGGFVVSTTPAYYFTADADRALVANFAPLFTITTTVAPPNGGFTSGGGTYPSGATVVLTPTPQPGFVFVSWTEGGSLVCNSPTYTFVAAASRSITANFAPAWPVTTTASSTNGLTFGSGLYAAGTTATVRALPRTGYALSNWTESAAVVSSSSVYSFAVTTNRTLVASFIPDVTSVTFDFDTATPSLAAGQAVPFDQLSGSITAHWSSPLGAAFAVQTDSSTGYRLSKFSGNYLDPALPGGSLVIQFSLPVISVTLNFATLDFQPIVTPSPLRLTAYQHSTNTPAVASIEAFGTYNGADSMPMGVVTLTPTKPFDVLVLENPGGVTGFLVDNINVSIAPALTISRTPTNTAVLSWPGPSPSFELQQAWELGSGSWTPATNVINLVNATNNQVTLTPSGGRTFFRLWHP
jgi:hypothetical protein